MQDELKRHRDSKFMLVGGAAAFLLLVGGFFVYQKSLRANEEPPADEKTEIVFSKTEKGIPEGYARRATDGVLIEEGEQPEKVFAVMIENSSEAWPLSALAQARLVFEVPVEGFIPRFMAVYDDTQDIEKIGPVRSARPYFVNWARGLNVLYAHVGGSPEALSIIGSTATRDLNEFYNERFFWRSSDRYAPHNVYTSTDLLKDGFSHHGYEIEDFPSFYYEELAAGESEQRLVIPFSSRSPQYNAVWEYDREANVYIRSQNNKQQFDDNGEEIQASNIIVVFAEMDVIDAVGRLFIGTRGQGEAVLFRNGFRHEIVWNKESDEEPLQFLSHSGSDIALIPGNTWIEVIPLSTEVTVE